MRTGHRLPRRRRRRARRDRRARRAVGARPQRRRGPRRPVAARDAALGRRRAAARRRRRPGPHRRGRATVRPTTRRRASTRAPATTGGSPSPSAATTSGSASSRSSATRRSTRSPAPTLDGRHAAHDAIDAAIARWTVGPRPVRGRRGCCRTLGIAAAPGVHERRPRRRPAPGGTRLHRRVGPARRRPAALPRLPDPLRAVAGAHRPRPDARRAQPRHPRASSATATRRSLRSKPATSSATSRPWPDGAVSVQPVAKAKESKKVATSGSVNEASPAPVNTCW